jgi:hypothetical protein
MRAVTLALLRENLEQGEQLLARLSASGTSAGPG